MAGTKHLFIPANEEWASQRKKWASLVYKDHVKSMMKIVVEKSVTMVNKLKEEWSNNPDKRLELTSAFKAFVSSLYPDMIGIEEKNRII
jgi:hypothetical protein